MNYRYKGRKMKVSGIDEDFIEIINFLNTNGFCPWSSCDGERTKYLLNQTIVIIA